MCHLQVPPKKQDEKKPTVKDEPEEGEEKPTPERRLADAVRDAKIAALKVSLLRFGHHMKIRNADHEAHEQLMRKPGIQLDGRNPSPYRFARPALPKAVNALSGLEAAA